MLAEPPVAVLDANVDRHGTRKVAEAYLQLPLFEGGQEIEAKNFYRPRDLQVLAAHAADFPKIRSTRSIMFRRLAEGAGDAFRRRRRVRPDLQAAKNEQRAQFRGPRRMAKPSALPGFGLSLGFSLFYLSAIVLDPAGGAGAAAVVARAGAVLSPK
jgi:hypothetical protein